MHWVSDVPSGRRRTKSAFYSDSRLWPFVHVDGTASNVPIRVFVLPGKEAQAAVVLGDAERLLPYYERFFATKYPLPKLDIVVVSGGYETALEGWGAITSYAEDETFGDQLSGGLAGRRFAVEVVAHEMAHQWVGDLVDMHWWRDTFVAEGLAEFSQQRALADLYPELDSAIDDDYDVEQLLNTPVAPGTRPVISDVATDLDGDDGKAFGGATYDKSAAVLRQWQLTIGEAPVRSALAAYLRAHAYGSATFEDFWRAFGDPRAQSYGAAWLKRPGFPLVDVDVECVAGRSEVTLDQRAYVSDPRIGARYRKQLWPVPLEIDIAGTKHVVLTRAVSDSTFDFPQCGIASIDGDFRPYARIRYQGDASAALGVRPVRERTRLLYDYSALLQGGALTTRSYLAAVDSPLLFDGLGLAIAGITADRLDDTYDRLRGSPLSSEIAGTERRLLGPSVTSQRLDSPRTPADEHGLLRVLVALAASGDPTVSDRARAIFLTYTATRWPNSTYGLQYGTAAAGGVTAEPADVDRVEAFVRNDGLDSNVSELFLANVRNESMVPRILEDVYNDPRLRGGSFAGFLFDAGRAHPKLVYAYLQAHLHRIVSTTPPTQQAYVISAGIAQNLWMAAPANSIERFLNSAFPADTSTVAAAISAIRKQLSGRRSLENALVAGAAGNAGGAR